MKTFRNNDDDDRHLRTCCRLLGGVDDTYIIRLAIELLAKQLQGQDHVVRTYVAPPPVMRKAVGTLKVWVQKFGEAVRNFYPIDIEGQPLERTVKVQRARDQCDDVFTEMQERLRLLRGVLKASAPLLAESYHSDLQGAAWVLDRFHRSCGASLEATGAQLTDQQRKDLAEFVKAFETLEPLLVTHGLLRARESLEIQAADISMK